MINKILLLMLSFVSGRLLAAGPTTGSSAPSLSGMIRHVALGGAIYGLGLVLFTAGLGLTLVDLYEVHRQQQTLGLSELSLISVPMALLPFLAVVAWGLKLRHQFHQAREQQRLAAQSSVFTPLINALTTMINDYVAEQKVKRYSGPAEAVETPVSEQEIRNSRVMYEQ